MGLKFNGIGPGPGDGIDKSVGRSQTAIVCLGDFGNYQARLAWPNDSIPYF
jgi:hypothetical protein